mgnify:CR=1 FL=1
MVEIRRPVQTTQTSIKILETLIEKKNSTIKELAEELEIAESTTHRHLKTLQNEDLVVKVNNQYRASLYLYYLGGKELKQRDLYSAGHEVVENLSVQTGKHSWLYSLENHMCTPIYESSVQTSKIHYSVIGELTPLHSNAGGKAILSVLSDDRIDEILRDNSLNTRLPVRRNFETKSKSSAIEDMRSRRVKQCLESMQSPLR